MLLAFVFSFEAKSQCGQISLIGEFNGWAGDHNMTQDTANQDLWYTMISLNNASNTENEPDIVSMKFREDAAWTVNWGAADFPTGIGTQDGANIPVPIDTAANTTDYYVTFNCSTGEYSFMTASVTATRAYVMDIDGHLDEPEWNLGTQVAKLINGTLTDDPNVIHFGVAYDEDSLYIGLSINDVFPTIFEMGEVFIDGNNSGGPYDASDLHLRFNGPVVTIVQGPQDLQTSLGFALNPGVGYSAELAIPLAPFGIVPTLELQVGFDIIIGDGDSGTGVDYMMSWSGGLENYVMTDSFGTLVFADFAGVKEIEEISAIVAMYPNPSTGDVYLQVADNTFDGPVSVSVSDMTGRTVITSQENFRSNAQVRLDVEQLSTGIYFVSILDGDGKKAVKKLIVQ